MLVNIPSHNTLYQKDSYRLFLEKSFFNRSKSFYPPKQEFISPNRVFNRFVDHQISDLLQPLYDHLQPQFDPHLECTAIYVNALHGRLIEVPISCDQKLARTYAICTKTHRQRYLSDNSSIFNVHKDKGKIEFGNNTCSPPFLAFGDRCLALETVAPNYKEDNSALVTSTCNKFNGTNIDRKYFMRDYWDANHMLKQHDIFRETDTVQETPFHYFLKSHLNHMDVNYVAFYISVHNSLR